MIRLGLCCKFYKKNIKFRSATAKFIKSFNRQEQLSRLSEICLSNAKALSESISYCANNRIGCFRVTSRILPLKTHPELGFNLSDLPGFFQIKQEFSRCRQTAVELDIRLTFHPDQFVVLTAWDKDILQRSIQELDYHAQVAQLIGADVINIHAGGGYGNKLEALERLGKVLAKLKPQVRERLTLENDDRVYTPADLLPFCKRHNVPFVYDVYHHRLLPDKLSVRKTTGLALKTWNREPLFHLSSPKSESRNLHADYINIKDLPKEWLKLDVTVEIEAKAKELAVKRLIKDIG